MSALSTSAVNKSSKKLAPKAPAARRRPQATAPTPPLSAAESRRSVSDSEHGEQPPSKRQRLESAQRVLEHSATPLHRPSIPTPPPTQPATTQTSTPNEPSSITSSLEQGATSRLSAHQAAAPTQNETVPVSTTAQSSQQRSYRASSSPRARNRNTPVLVAGSRDAASSVESANSLAQLQVEPLPVQSEAGRSQGADQSTLTDNGIVIDPASSESTARSRGGRAGKARQARGNSSNDTRVLTEDETSAAAGATNKRQAKSKSKVAAQPRAATKSSTSNTSKKSSNTRSRRGKAQQAQSEVANAAEESAVDQQHHSEAGNEGSGQEEQAASGSRAEAAPGTRASQGRKTTARHTARAHLQTSNTNSQEQEPLEIQIDEPAEMDEAEAEGQGTTIKKPRKPRKPREREKTPEDAENHEIDIAKVSMTALTRDTRKGKKSKIEAAMQEIDWTEVVRKRKEAEDRAYEHGELERSEQQVNARLDRAGEQNMSSSAPRTKIVNGQIVIDTASLVVDRHAAAAADSANQPVEELEETDLTTHVTSHSWVHDSRRDPEERRLMKMKSDPWSKEQTNNFYKALAMFGTDFFIISKMFPGKTRRQIKLKFVREERSDPARINAAVLGQHTTPMDIDTYSEATGRDQGYYKDPQQLEAELKDEEERQKLEIAQQREEQEQAQRDKQRRAAEKSAAAQRERAAKKAGGKRGKGRGGASGGMPEPGPGAEGVEVAVEPVPSG